MSVANVNGQSDTRKLAGLLGWLAAVSLFAAGLVTALLEFDITASPPRTTAPNDLLEGTLAFFQNESDRWPQELASLILFTVGFVALIGLVALVRNAVGRDDPWLLLGTLAVGVGAGIGAVGQLLYGGPRRSALIRTTVTAPARPSRSSAGGRFSGCSTTPNDGCSWGRWPLSALASY